MLYRVRSDKRIRVSLPEWATLKMCDAALFAGRRWERHFLYERVAAVWCNLILRQTEREQTVGEAYIRIDVRIPRDYLQRFLQGLRDIEQEAPSSTHMVVQVYDNDASLKESEELVRSLTPAPAYVKSIPKQ